MREILLLLLLFGGTFNANSQSIERSIIGGAGFSQSNSNNSTLSWAIGEVITTTSSSNKLTQGFHQPIYIQPLSTNHFQQEITLAVFPNPTARYIYIKTNSDEKLQAVLINMLGQVIRAYPIYEELTQIDLDDLPSATYLLQVKTNNTTIQSFKIQKAH